jgi:hypothetical protein
MSETLIGIIHIFTAVLISIYAFIFKNPTADYLYLFIVYFLLLHWTFLNSECVISYVIKKMKNKNYVAGEATGKSEMFDVFAKNNYLIYFFDFIVNVVWTITVYLVLVRNKFNLFYYLPFVFLFGIYKAAILYSTNHHKNTRFLILQDSIKYSLILYGFFFIPLLFKRFMSKRKQK